MNTHGKTDKSIHLQHRFMRSYKKNTMALFLCFTLGITLITSLLTLIHTNHKMENIQGQMLFTDSDCSVGGIEGSKVEKLMSDPDLKWYAVEQLEYARDYEKNSQSIWIDRGDDSYITLTARVEDGRLPQAENEIVAERWTLLNIGIEPKCNQEFDIYNKENGQTETYRLTGILSDMASNKKYGVKTLYAPIKPDGEDMYTVYVRFQDQADYEEKVTDICKELDIREKQVKKCPGREDMKGLWQTDVKMAGVLLFITVVVFYGVYRIAMISRRSRYGVLRAVGMTRGQLLRVILLELYEIYALSIPAGCVLGILIALFISHLSGDSSKEIYLNNEQISFAPVIPVVQIAICVAVIALFIGLAGYLTGKKIIGQPVPELTAGLNGGEDQKPHRIGRILRWRQDDRHGRMHTLLSLGAKYILKDKRTSLFVVLTISVGVTLFTGLAYQKELAKYYREDTKEMYYLNGQYEMGTLGMDSALEGISRDSAASIASLDGVSSIKSQAGIPVRVIDDKTVERNDAYYDEMNERLIKNEGYPASGYDGDDQIYKSVLYGYNRNALSELKKYVIAGDYDENGLEEDEIILSVLHMDDRKENGYPGNYKYGTPLMQYRPGDRIQVKYRRDFDTANLAYEELTDTKEDYEYRTYKVAAIVSFAYMYDSNITVYPLLITSDEQVQKLCPDSHIQRMYIDGVPSLTEKDQENLERQLIRLGNKNKNISTRSMISDIRNNEMLYQKQMVYIIGIAVIAFILVLINMVNNLSYRMKTRTQEICMFRAVGMSVKMIRRMMIFENGLLGLAGIALAFLCANPVLLYLYRQSDMKAFGHPYKFAYPAFAAVSVLTLLICVLLAAGLSKDWKTRRITERMNQVE